MTGRDQGRGPSELRPFRFEVGYAPYAEGSVLVSAGNTRVLCTASVEERIPRWLEGKGRGWVTAEYGMLPRSTHTRIHRERASSSGRTHEIQRLIGRSLRAVTSLPRLGERQITLDCDVLQADGGTRTASITGAWVALAQACLNLQARGLLESWPLTDHVTAISVGRVDGEILVDLDYPEDSRAEVDANLVMTGRGLLVEVQATAEGNPFEQADLDRFVARGREAIGRLVDLQRRALCDAGLKLPEQAG